MTVRTEIDDFYKSENRNTINFLFKPTYIAYKTKTRPNNKPRSAQISHQ